LKRCHDRRTELAPRARSELGEAKLERELCVGGSGVETLEDLRQPLPRRRRARYLERPLPLGETAVEDQPRKAAEVISVQVRHGHEGDAGRIEAVPLQRRECARAAVDQQW